MRTPDPVATRRALLTIAAGGGALAACGDGGGAPAPGPSRESQAATFNSALAFEHAVAAAYESGERLLRGRERRALRDLHARERAYATRLAELVRRLGGEPAAPRTRREYRRGFPLLHDGRDVLRFAEDLEERSVRKYLEALPRLAEPELRRAMAEIAVDQGRHLALVRDLRDEPPAPDAFVTGTT